MDFRAFALGLMLAGSSPSQPVPAPVISDVAATPPGLSQTSAPLLGNAFTLTVNGQNFETTSRVLLGATPLPTTYTNSTQLAASVPVAALAGPGTAGISVVNADGATSNVVNFQIVERGDLNGNRRINIADALVAALSAGGLRKPPLSVSVGDIDFSGSTTIADALILALYAAGITANLPSPTVTLASPNPVAPGATLTLSGTGFSPEVSENLVLFTTSDEGALRVVPASATATTLTVIVPASAVSGPIEVFRLGPSSGSPEFPLFIQGTPTPLAVTSVSPSYQVAPGATITVAGMGFDSTAANNAVMFRSAAGTVNGTVTTASETSLTVVAPQAAQCGSVTVSSGGRVSNARAIVISPATCPLSLSDLLGGGNPGDAVVIEGVGFDEVSPANNVVSFATAGGGTVSATVLQAGRTQIHVTIPSAAVTGNVTVAANGAVSNALTYRRPAPPAVTSIAPNRVPAGSTLNYVLTGSGFIAGGTTVTVEGAAITVGAVNVAGSTSITASLTVDSGAVTGARAVTVTTAAGSAGTTLTLAPPPLVSSVNPANGVTGSTIGTMTISGSQFDLFNAPVLAFIPAGGSTPDSKFQVSALTTSATAVSFTLAIGSSNAVVSTGAYRVEVRDGSSPTQIHTQTTDLAGVNVFQVLPKPPPPALGSISPSSGAQGTFLTGTASGSNFVVGATTITISGTGVTAGITPASATSATVTFAIAPGAAPGSRSVFVTTAGGNSGNVTFTVSAAASPTTTSTLSDVIRVRALPFVQSAVSGVVRAVSARLTGTMDVFSDPVHATLYYPGAPSEVSVPSPLVRVLSRIVPEEIASPVVAINACAANVALGSNLVVNAGAELNAGAGDAGTAAAPACWTAAGGFGAVQYGVTGFPTANSGYGVNFFAGGPNNAASSASQTIDVSALSAQIDTGTATATLSALLGGKTTQSDNMTVKVTFQSAGGATLGTLTIGPVTAANRSNATMVSRSGSVTVPAQTRTVAIAMTATRTDDTYNDAYADNLSLVFTVPAAAMEPIPDRSYSTFKESQFVAVRVRNRKYLGQPDLEFAEEEI